MDNAIELLTWNYKQNTIRHCKNTIREIILAVFYLYHSPGLLAYLNG